MLYYIKFEGGLAYLNHWTHAYVEAGNQKHLTRFNIRVTTLPVSAYPLAGIL